MDCLCDGALAPLVVGYGESNFDVAILIERELRILLHNRVGADPPLPADNLAVRVGGLVGELHLVACGDAAGRAVVEVSYWTFVGILYCDGLGAGAADAAVGDGGELDFLLARSIERQRSFQLLAPHIVGAPFPFARHDNVVGGGGNVGYLDILVDLVHILVGGKVGVDRHLGLVQARGRSEQGERNEE